jgi:diguanylate cyclase (GGDEF)-like protein/PAS domain S-box-containing protein
MWPQTEEAYHSLVHGGRPAETRWMRAVKTDGSEIWLSLTERVVKWGTKDAVQWTLFDITQRVTVEQSLLESEQRLSAMLQILPTPIYIERRVDGQLLFVNRKTCLMFQQSASPLMKRKSVDFFVDREAWVQTRFLLDATSEAREVEVQMKTAQGRTFVAEMAAIAIEYAGSPAVLTALNDISQRKQLEAELFHEASTDPLTGISNRRYFMTQAEADFRRAKRYSHKMGLLMCDLDHFKEVNDTYGHAAGDAVLQEVVKAIQSSLRESDIMGRLGGEEFAVLLPETDADAALEVANRVRAAVAERKIEVENIVLSRTTSIGVAHIKPEDAEFDTLLMRADDAMYRAKNSGRNRIVVSE